MHKMTKILHQQQLLLELLCMSGNIAVTENNDGTILRKTLMETKAAGWITLTPFGKGFDMAAITDFGRRVNEPSSCSVWSNEMTGKHQSRLESQFFSKGRLGDVGGGPCRNFSGLMH